MSHILRQAFGFFAKAPPQGAPEKPVPMGEWTIPVNANGDMIVDRPPAAGDFMARPAIAMENGGTIPVFTPDKRFGYERNNTERMAFEMRERDFAKVLNKAIFMLSQTDDGRYLLKRGKEQGFVIVNDDRKLDERKAAGLADYANKLIPVHSRLDAAEMALVLKHELQHMEDMGNGVSYSTNAAFRSALGISRAMEASARTSEAVFCHEARYGSPKGPAWQYRPAGIWENFARKLPQMSAQARAGAALMTQGKIAEFAASVFPAFYREEKTLAYYDQDLMAAYDKRLDEMETEAGRGYRQHKTGFMASTADIGAVSKGISIGGQKYMHLMSFDPAADAAVGLLRASEGAYTKLASRIGALRDGQGAKPVVECHFAPEAPPEKPAAKWFWPRREKTPPQAEPIAQVSAPAAPAAFESIILPHGRVGETASSDRARLLGHIIETKGYVINDNDVLSFALTDAMRGQNPGVVGSNFINDLAKAGFRAPIAALPEVYVMNLSFRVQQAAERKGASDTIGKGELELFDHWRAMAAKGLDPMNGGLKKGYAEEFSEMEFYGRQLASHYPVSNASAPVAVAPTNVRQRAREILATIPPEKRNTVVLKAAAPKGKKI